MTTTLITGIAGQDGSFLAEYLLGKGHDVHGMIRRNSTPENQTGRLDKILDELTLHYGDVTDPVSCNRIVEESEPDEIYNLAGQSHVGISSDMPYFTAQVNGIGVLNMLEAYRTHAPYARFYQASSSEMFGNECNEDGYQSVDTKMLPVSPYGCAKLYGFNMVRHYRNAYSLHCSNGILFNHESERRGSNFVTAKVVKTALEIKYGMAEKLVLGNMDSFRDWGYAGDYVRAMELIVSQEEPVDWVVATGETRSVRNLCRDVFKEIGLTRWEHLVETDARFMRPQELSMLRGDAVDIKAAGWRPRVPYEMMIQKIIRSWECELQKLKRGATTQWKI